MKLIEEGDACPKNKCIAGSPMCDAIFVKCACGFGSLAGVFKRFFESW